MNPQQIQNLISQKIQEFTRSSLKLPRHTHNRVDSESLDPKYFLKYSTLIAPNMITVITNGTTSVNVFSNGLPMNITYKAILSIALDGTAGTITFSNNGNTVTTIAKGTTLGAVIGGTSYTNTLQIQNTPATVVSSSTGNSLLLIFYVA